MRAGDAFPDMVFGPVTRDAIAAYAAASGDDNPIHTDEAYARATGAPGVFAMGMLPAGHLATALGAWCGGPERIRRFKVRFTTRVWPGDELVCRATVTAVDGATASIEAGVWRRGPGPDGLDLPEEERAVTAWAEVDADVDVE